MNLAIFFDSKKRKGSYLTGIERLVINLIELLKKNQKNIKITIICFDYNYDYSCQLFKNSNINIEKIKAYFFSKLPAIILKTFNQNILNKFDYVFFPSQFSVIFKTNKKAKYLLLINDLCQFDFPDNFLKKIFYKLFLKLSIKNSDYIFTLDDYWVEQIKKTYKAKNIATLKAGINLGSFKTIEKKILNKTYPLPTNKRYILHIGSGSKRKSTDLILKNIDKLHSDFDIIIIGRKNFEHPRIHFLENVDDFQLFYLYKNAFCYLLISLCEGDFTYPAIEALFCSCPVVAFNLPTYNELKEYINLIETNEKALIKFFNKPYGYIKKEFTKEAIENKILKINQDCLSIFLKSTSV